MYLIDTRKYNDSFLLAKILEKVDFTDEEKKKLFKHFEKPEVVDVDSLIAKHEDIGYEKGYRDGYAEALEVTDDAKRHGYWSLNPHNRAWDVCSACGIGTKRREYGLNPDGTEYVTEYSYRYCPNCGARIDEEKR